MITLLELLQGRIDFKDCTPEQQKNLPILLARVNKIREAYGKSMKVSSGLRSMADHLRIYAEKGITDQSKIPMKSRHLSGQAVDFADPKKVLQKWIKSNIDVLEACELWCEDFSATPTWIHFQTVPPASGKRFFTP